MAATDKRKIIKKEIPPKDGFACVFQRTILSTLLLVPKFPENVTSNLLIRYEKKSETIKKEI